MVSNKLRVITEDDLIAQNDKTDELEKAVSFLNDLISAYKEKHSTKPTKVYISDNEELQSLIMYAADLLGMKYERTFKKTYLV